MRQTRTNRKHIKYCRLSEGGLHALSCLQEDLKEIYEDLEMKGSFSASISILLDWYGYARVFQDMALDGDFVKFIKKNKLY